MEEVHQFQPNPEAKDYCICGAHRDCDVHPCYKSPEVIALESELAQLRSKLETTEIESEWWTRYAPASQNAEIAELREKLAAAEQQRQSAREEIRVYEALVEAIRRSMKEALTAPTHPEQES